MPLLRAINANAAKINASPTRRSSRSRKNPDQLYIQGLKELYQKATRTSIRWATSSDRKLFGHLEKVVDCFEDVANRISGILLEHM